MTDSETDFGHRLRERRRSAGLTRARLADRTGIEAADIARWERGEGAPGDEQVRALDQALDPGTERAARRPDSARVGPEGSGPPPPSDGEPPRESSPDGATSSGRGLWDKVVGLVAPGGGDSAGGSASVTPLRSRPGQPRPTPSAASGLVAPPRRGPQVPVLFPDVPVAAYDPEVHVYSTAPARYPGPGDDQFYLLRRVRTAGVLLGLAILLWWASGALWEGLGEMLDLLFAPASPAAPGGPL